MPAATIEATAGAGAAAQKPVTTLVDVDLTSTLLKFVDRHLGFPLLAHLASLDIYKEEDIAKATYELAKGTSMADYTIQLFEQAFPGKQPPAELEKQREEALSTNDRLAKESEKVLTVIEDPNVLAALKQDKAQNLIWLEQNYQLTVEQIEALYRYGYFHYSCGNYGEASLYLYHFRVLSTDPTLTMSSHWGKLASDILTGEWDRALEELRLLREHIDTQRPDEGGHEVVLQRRTWLLHWSLFVWFNHPNGRSGLVELFLSPPYLNVIQTTSWWLLRYLVASLVLTRRSVRFYSVPQPPTPLNPNPSSQKLSTSAALRDLTRVLSQESHRLRPDPLIDFVRQLYVDFDFEGATEELKKVRALADADFFLQEHAAELLESARFLVSEAYCRLHQKVDIGDLSARLNLSRDEGEKWVVNLIRESRTDAKIDLARNTVYMNQPQPAVYQTVIEKTRGFSFRTAAMAQAMDRKAHPPQVASQVAGGANGATAGGDGGRGGRGGGRGGRGGRGGGGGGGGRGGGRGGAPGGVAGGARRDGLGSTTTTTTPAGAGGSPAAAAAAAAAPPAMTKGATPRINGAAADD